MPPGDCGGEYLGQGRHWYEPVRLALTLKAVGHEFESVPRPFLFPGHSVCCMAYGYDRPVVGEDVQCT